MLAVILKTVGDFFLDSKGDGDPMRFWAFALLVAALVEIPFFWEMTAGLGVGAIILYILAIWHEREPRARKPADPTQGVPRS